eukprot:GHVP01006234.1.p1 GENE.GHVP01006234.1~~GHVP01006234.1.p1  ORF type:complete len:393 (+),score=80.13 GHVP01006234.1:581-1759(+)
MDHDANFYFLEDPKDLTSVMPIRVAPDAGMDFRAVARLTVDDKFQNFRLPTIQGIPGKSEDSSKAPNLPKGQKILESFLEFFKTFELKRSFYRCYWNKTPTAISAITGNFFIADSESVLDPRGSRVYYHTNVEGKEAYKKNLAASPTNAILFPLTTSDTKGLAEELAKENFEKGWCEVDGVQSFYNKDFHFSTADGRYFAGKKNPTKESPMKLYELSEEDLDILRAVEKLNSTLELPAKKNNSMKRKTDSEKPSGKDSEKPSGKNSNYSVVPGNNLNSSLTPDAASNSSKSLALDKHVLLAPKPKKGPNALRQMVPLDNGGKKKKGSRQKSKASNKEVEGYAYGWIGFAIFSLTVISCAAAAHYYYSSKEKPKRRFSRNPSVQGSKSSFKRK